MLLPYGRKNACKTKRQGQNADVHYRDTFRHPIHSQSGIKFREWWNWIQYQCRRPSVCVLNTFTNMKKWSFIIHLFLFGNHHKIKTVSSQWNEYSLKSRLKKRHTLRFLTKYQICDFVSVLELPVIFGLTLLSGWFRKPIYNLYSF